MTALDIQKNVLDKLYTLAIKHPDTKRISINPQTKIDKQYNQPHSSTIQYQKDQQLNQAVEELADKLFVTLEHARFSNKMFSDNYKAIVLNREQLSNIKQWLIKHRITPIDDAIQQRQQRLNWLKTNCQSPISQAQIDKLQMDLNKFKLSRTFDTNLQLIKAIEALPNKPEDALYSRELSQYVFHDTKSLEPSGKRNHTNHRQKLETILADYNDSLANHYILETDKNQAIIEFYAPDDCLYQNHQLTHHVAISTTGYNLNQIETTAKRIISIENQTAFQRLCRTTNLPHGTLLTYTGGQAANDFEMLYAQFVGRYPDIKLYHFGDLDLSGFHILDELNHYMQQNVDRPVKPWFMNCNVIEHFSSVGHLLTKAAIQKLTKQLPTVEPDRQQIYQMLIDQQQFIEQELVAYWITQLPTEQIVMSFK